MLTHHYDKCTASMQLYSSEALHCTLVSTLIAAIILPDGCSLNEAYCSRFPFSIERGIGACGCYSRLCFYCFNRRSTC